MHHGVRGPNPQEALGMGLRWLAVAGGCLALSWAAGCGVRDPLTASNSLLEGQATVTPDSTRWVTPGRVQPYALVWKSGVMNLWTWGNPLVVCTPSSPTRVLDYDAVFRAKVPSILVGGGQIQGFLVTWRSANGSTVTKGTFTAVVGPTANTMTGFIVTVLAGPCGAVLDTTRINLVRK